MPNPRTIFLTGATGLVGSYLLKIFLQKHHRVYALARSRDDKTAQERVLKRLAFWGSRAALGNLVILEGDITKARLGLDAPIFRGLTKEIEEIYHCAAIVNLKWPLAKVRKVNVGGTKKVLDFAIACHKNARLVKVNHISTAYIYGNYKGSFSENDLDVGQKFNTTYEQSKFEAEAVVGAYRKKGLWIDVFRPPIIVGHSQSGKILRFNNVYQFLYLCNLGIFNSLPISGICVMLNAVDYVCEAIYLISSGTKKKNQNYHLFPEKPVPVEKFVSYGCQLMGLEKPKIVSLDGFQMANLTPAQRAILNNNILSIDFNNRLNSSYTNQLLKGYGFSFSEINEQFLTGVLKYFVKNG